MLQELDGVPIGIYMHTYVHTYIHTYIHAHMLQELDGVPIDGILGSGEGWERDVGLGGDEL